MTKTITKIGNSNGIIFDAAFMDMAHLKTGDTVAVSLHDGGTITMTPVSPRIEAKKAADVARKLIRKNSELFQRLA